MGSKLSLSSSPKSTVDAMFSQSDSVPYPSATTVDEKNYNPNAQPLHIVPYQSPRFDASDPQLAEYLKEHGYAVIKNVATPEEVDIAKSLLWQFLEKKAFMKRDDPSTWTDANFCKLGSTRNGILAFNGINHSEFLWYLRLLPKVKLAFSQIFQTDDLITSFDGGNIFRPWHSPQADEFSKTSSGWFHVDQGKTLRGLQAVQGLVTLTDVNEFTGGFCAIPGSQTMHDTLVDTAALGDRNYVQIPNDFPTLQDPQILPICSAGDMILWDSRCIHCNTPALQQPNTDPGELLRAVGYVCMTPRSFATDEVIANRVRLFERAIGTTHWPHLTVYEVDPEDTHYPIVHRINEVSEEQRSLVIGKQQTI